MKFLGFEIRKADPAVSSQAQIRDTDPQGPLTSAFDNWIFRRVAPGFYEVLREGIPMLDAAIGRLISMNGMIEIIGDKDDCVAELEDFCRSVPVGDMQQGIEAFRTAWWGEALEQGFGISEMVATRDLKDIAGLRVADSKNILFWRNRDGRAEPWYRYPDKSDSRPLTDPAQLMDQIVNARYGQRLVVNQQEMVKLRPENKLYLAHMVENSNPYGVSLLRSMEWVAQILATLQASIKNSADRFGDPMYHLHSSGKVPADRIQKLLDDLTEKLTTTVNIKRRGGSADLVTAGGENSRVDIKVLGHDGQLYAYEIPLRHVEEQLVSKTGLAGWMLGKYWSTTERMAQLEVEVVLADGAMRNTAERPRMTRLFSDVLALRGRKWKTITTDPDKPGDWGFRYRQPNLHNVVAEAQARFLNAQANMMERGSSGQSAASVRNQDQEVTIGGQASVEIEGMKFPMTLRRASSSPGPRVKELSRPFPWPQLDAVEAEYEAGLKYDWRQLRDDVFVKLALPLPDNKSTRSPHGERAGVRGGSEGADTDNSLAPQGERAGVKGGSKDFSFGDEERRAVLDSLKDFLGWNDPADPDGSVRWGYMQAYSLGLIKAAHLMSEERPLIDVLKNRETFEQIVQTGFQLVRNNATNAIKDSIIPAMERLSVSGANPREVAAELSRLFDDKNDDWERLARSEMNLAAEKGKRDEWEARGVDTSDAVLPVQDTHPRCRCSNTVRLVDGKWKMVFVPAPDACAWCQALAA